MTPDAETMMLLPMADSLMPIVEWHRTANANEGPWVTERFWIEVQIGGVWVPAGV